MESFFSKIGRQIYAEKRYLLEKLAGFKTPGASVRHMGRARTLDYGATAIKYRMGAGFPGDVNRVHPASIEPCLIDASAPPFAYGIGVVVDPTTQGVRPIVAGDSALTDIYGVTVRAFPIQQGSVNPQFNTGVPPTSGVIDVLRAGYIMVQLGNSTLTGALKGSLVDIWFAVASGAHVQGNFEASHTGGSSSSLANPESAFNGVQDANGIVELGLHRA